MRSSKTNQEKKVSELLNRFLSYHKVKRTPVSMVLRRLQRNDLEAALFGGTIRDLIYRTPRAPRDIDIVVAEASVDELRRIFADIIVRETRFGGLHLRCSGVLFDVWPLQDTWAIKKNLGIQSSFEHLPRTTFLNIESIAATLFPKKGKQRKIYSTHFFDALRSRILEVNLESNPFPELCVIRSLLTATRFDLQIGPKLAAYVKRHGSDLTARDISSIQLQHYGSVKLHPESICNRIHYISEEQSRNSLSVVRLPLSRPLQLSLFDAGRSC